MQSRLSRPSRQPRPSSEFRWVRRSSPNRFQARPWFRGVHVNLGTFDSEEQAWFAIRRWIRSGRRVKPGRILPRYVRPREGKFYARKKVGGEWQFFGPFDTPERAARAVRTFLAVIVGGEANLSRYYPEEFVGR